MSGVLCPMVGRISRTGVLPRAAQVLNAAGADHEGGDRDDASGGPHSVGASDTKNHLVTKDGGHEVPATTLFSRADVVQFPPTPMPPITGSE